MLILNQQKYQTNLARCQNTRGVFAVFKISQEDVSEINTRIIFWLLLANEFTKTYQYDSVGNRTATEVTGETWRYNANHQLENYGTEGNLTTYTYDDNGSTISKTDSTGTEEYLYDVAGHLTQVKKNSVVTVNYYYNPMGKRLWKEINGQKTYFIYANEGMIAEYNNSGSLIQSYQYQPESMWGTAPLSMIKDGEANFYQHDQIGTPNLLTSKSGEVKWQGAVDAFGKVTTTTSSIDNAIRFPGQYLDSETGYHQSYFRDYDPKIGRYIQSDPIGLAGGVNTYGYALQNPMMNIDPFGLYVPPSLPQGLVDFAAGFGDTLSFGATRGLRNLAGIGSVNYCSGAYSNGEWGGIGLSLAFGGAHLGRNALNQMGRRGGLGQRITRGVGRIFSDPRSWGATRSMWSRAAGNGTAALAARGQSLHHWLIPQRLGSFNASFNYLPLTASFNSWMNGSTAARIAVEQGLRASVLGIYGAPVTAAISDGCECN